MLRTAAVLSLNGAPQVTLSPHGVEAQGEAFTAAPGVSTRRVMQLLGAKLRIKITDGRVVVGTFHCFDKHQNVILTDTREYLPLHRAAAVPPTGSGKKGAKHHKQQQQQQHEEEDTEEEEKELWKTGTSRSLGMALVPGKHIVYIKVQQSPVAAAVVDQ